MLSKMEVGRLLRAVSVQKVLNFEQFSDWVCRAAIRSFSKVPYCDEMTTTVAKVEKMLSIIDNASVVQSIVTARGRQHHRSFARRHNESVASRGKERTANAAALLKDVVERTKAHVGRTEFGEELQRIFQFYCTYGEEKPMDSMKGFMFYKLCRDSSLLDEKLSYERVDLLFLHHVGNNNNKKARMSYDQFIAAVMEIAQRKFPGEDRFDAFVRVVTTHILPGARRADKEAPVIQSFTHPRVTEVFAKEANRNIVRLLFYYYARNEGRPRGRGARMEDMLSLKDISNFAKDFGISSRVASHQELARMYRACGGAPGNDDEVPCLELEAWQQLMCRLAMHWGRIDDSSSPAEVAQRLHKFLRSLENSEAMINVESWRVRTQTHKRALYKMSS